MNHIVNTKAQYVLLPDCILSEIRFENIDEINSLIVALQEIRNNYSLGITEFRKVHFHLQSTELKKPYVEVIFYAPDVKDDWGEDVHTETAHKFQQYLTLEKDK